MSLNPSSETFSNISNLALSENAEITRALRTLRPGIVTIGSAISCHGRLQSSHISASHTWQLVRYTPQIGNAVRSGLTDSVRMACNVGRSERGV